MPITSHRDEAKGLTIFTVTGALTFIEALKVVDTFYDGNPTKNVVWDLLEATNVQLTSKEVRRLAVYPPRFEGNRASGKTAIVTQEDAFLELAQMFAMQNDPLQKPYPIVVLHNTDEAYQWFDEP